MRHLLKFFAVTCLSLCVVSWVHAAPDYPTRPVTLVVPWPPGGFADSLSRMVAKSLQASLGNVVVLNRPGAGSLIGTEYVMNAAPDGYTILLGSSTMTVLPAVRSDIKFDAVRSFTPIAPALSGGYVLAVKADSPIQSVSALLTHLRANEGRRYGTSGIGTGIHLTSEHFNQLTKVKSEGIAFKGSEESVSALAAGLIDFAFDTPATMLKYIQSGKIRPIAVTTRTRMSALPNVPTLDESGLPAFSAGWFFGFFAPANTPADVVSRLHKEFASAMRDPAMLERAASQGAEVMVRSTEEFTNDLRKESEQWKGVAKNANVKLY